MREQNHNRWLSVVLFLLVFFSASVSPASEVTVTGEVNDNYQIVADQQIYDIADTAEGNDLAENYISERVTVTGTVEIVDDQKILTVHSFKLAAE